MQSRLSSDNLQKVSCLGIYESILHHDGQQICKIGSLSMIEGCFTDFNALYTVLKVEKIVSGVLEQ